jgi:signal transduction histidine kinase
MADQKPKGIAGRGTSLPAGGTGSVKGRAALFGAFLLAAGAALVALLAGSDIGSIVGVSVAGVAGVVILGQLLVTERRRHQVAEEELAGQASFLESLVASFGTIASKLEVGEILELTRSEAERLFAARAELLESGERRPHGPEEHELVLPLHVHTGEVARVRLVRERPFGRDDLAQGSILADFAARAVENAQLLAEAKVREADRARLSDQLITAEQEERRRLAVYLHDTSVQALSGLTLMLDAAADLVRQGRVDEAESILANVLERQRTEIRGLRDLSFNIEPVVLRDQGFGPAVQALASQLGMEQQIRIEVDVDAADGLAQRAQAALYQIIREALHSSIRRGPPTHVSIHVSELADGGVELVIADDAPGERRRTAFDPIGERARTLSGSLEVDRGEDGGTTVRVKLPAYAAR